MNEPALRLVRPRPHRRLVRFLSLVGLVLVCGTLLLYLPALHVQEITVSATRSMTRSDLVAASGIASGQHLFRELGGSPRQWLTLRYGPVEQRLAATFPYIRSVTVQMDFPGQISIDVTERIEVAYVAIPDGCVMIDKDAVALRILAEPPEAIPVIEGVSVTSLVLGSPLDVNVPEAMHSAVTIMGAIIEADKDTRTDQPLLRQVRKIRPVGGRQLYLTLALPDNSRELIVAAETGSDQQEDMLWLRFAMAQGALDNLGKGILDLTGSRRVFVPDES